MKKTWEGPNILVQEFEANEYVAACWGVACIYDWANNYEQTNYASRGETWWDRGCSHAKDHCGFSGNQVLKDPDGNGEPNEMVEVGTDGLGTLDCIIYSDPNYNNRLSLSQVTSGATIYWTTTSGNRTWHHKGTVQDTVPGHPNRS